MNVYDFDGTIYDGDSTMDFYKYCLKRNPLLIRFLPKQVLGIVKYKCKRINKTEMKEYFFCFLKAVKVEEEMLLLFWQDKRKKIYNWYLEQNDTSDIIISASPQFLLEPICSELKVHLIASKVDTKSGKFTGHNCYGVEKVNRIREQYGDNVIVNAFYSDSKSDLPMAQIAQEAYLCRGGTITKWN